MLTNPASTTREQKWQMISRIEQQLWRTYGGEILAIGVYGSVAQEMDGPDSDMEIHVITKDGCAIPEHEFILPPFKIEISPMEREAYLQKAATLDDSWPITAGYFAQVHPLHDPDNIFAKAGRAALQIDDKELKEVMRIFMIWEPYETMGKIRNSREAGNTGYLTLGATDLVWKTAKLIGLANKQYFHTRAETYEESLQMPSRPAGYDKLARLVMAGDLTNKHDVYQCCENLWTGLNEWFQEMGISYIERELPFRPVE